MKMEMEKEFDQITKITSDGIVTAGEALKELINKELCLGMTRYVCRNGTLSDGHECLTDADRYYQAIRECYHISMSIKSQKAVALEAQADLLDAQDMQTGGRAAELRKEAAIMKAKDRLVGALVSSEDLLRQLDEFNKVRLELQEKVRAQYPEGIEQSQPDRFIAMAKYRHFKRSVGYPENLTHVPLDKNVKAKLGIEIGNGELQAWMYATEPKVLELMSLEMKKTQSLLGGKVG